MGRQNERTGPLGCGHLGGLFLIALVATPNREPLEQAYYKGSSMEEGWLIDRDDCWIWRFHHDSTSRNKAGVFIDRGRRMPSGPPLLKERRHLLTRQQSSCGCPCRPKGGNRLKNPHGEQQQMSEDHGSAANRYPKENPPLPERQTRHDRCGDRRGVLVDG